MTPTTIGTALLCLVAFFVIAAIAVKEWERYVRREKQREDDINNESSPTS